MKNLLLILAVSVLLTGCGTTKTVSPTQLAEPLGKGKARLIIERDNSLLYLAAAADVSVNGAKAASLGRGGSVMRDVPAHPSVVSVTTAGAFGNFTLLLDPAAGKTYRLIVSPNGDQLLLGSAFGIVGDAVRASISENTGYFQIELKP